MRRINQPSDAEVDDFVRLYEEHGQIKIVAEITGWSRGCVMRWLRSRGIYGKRPGRVQQYDHDEIVADYLSGMSARDVAALHGCEYSTVYWVLKGRGIPRRTQSRTMAIKRGAA